MRRPAALPENGPPTLFLSVARGSAAGLALPLVGVVKSIVLVPVLLACLGEHSYGIYVLTATGLSYALILAGFGLDSSMYRFSPTRMEVDAGRSTLAACLTVAAISGGSVFAASVLLQSVFPPAQNLVWLPPIAGAVCFFQALWSVSFAYERARDRLTWFVLAALAFNVLEFLVLAVTAWLRRDVSVMFAAALCLNAVWAVVWLGGQVGAVGLAAPTRRELAAVARFGAHTVVNTLVLGAFLTIDKFVLGYVAGAAVLAWYAPAAGLAQILGSLAALSLISVPHLLARSHDQNRDAETRLVLRHGLGIYLFLGVPALAGLGVTAEPLLALLVGPALAMKGAPIAAVFAAGLFVFGLQRFFIQMLRVHGRSAWVNLVSALSLCLYIAGLAAAVALDLDLPYAIPVLYLSVVVVQTAIVWRRATVQCGPVLFLRDAVQPTAIAAISILPGLLLDLSWWPSLVAYMAGAAGIYFSVSALWWRWRWRMAPAPLESVS